MSLSERKYKILIVDDVAENRRILAGIITRDTNYNVLLVSDSENLIEKIKSDPPDLILLDIMMPVMDGFEVAEKLKAHSATKDIPIIFITAVTDTKSIVKAFNAGGVDYITKPFKREELISRVNTHLNLKRMRDDLQEKNLLLSDREAHLSKLVDEKTQKLEKLTYRLVSALETVNYYNDTDTGNHIKRVSEYSTLFAELYGLDKEIVKKIKLYSSLHDVGKVGLPDALLKKSGRYTPEEFKKMQEHVVIGARMLEGEEIDAIARNIALYHHEKWDGTGYVNGLKEEEIPIEARIVTISDIYDALGTKRVYKDAFPEEKIDDIIKNESGKQLDPRLVELYFKHKQRILEVKHFFSD